MNKMPDNVSRYYDLNTSRFLRFGHGKSAGAIHRAVWAGGVKTRIQAVDYINTLLGRIIRETGADRILDIGCGIGGSMVSLAEKTGADMTGVTISRVQAQTGKIFLEKNGCAGRCRIFWGDFNDPEVRKQVGGPFDLLFAVESFLHMKDPGQFFSSAEELLKEGGELVLCDDFLSSGSNPGAGASKKTARLLARFQEGWQTGPLSTAKEVESLAKSRGFACVSREDLTPFLELNRPRDLSIRALVPFITLFHLSSPFWQNMTGGDALQRLLLRGQLKYQVIRLKRFAPGGRKEVG